MVQLTLVVAMAPAHRLGLLILDCKRSLGARKPLVYQSRLLKLEVAELALLW